MGLTTADCMEAAILRATNADRCDEQVLEDTLNSLEGITLNSGDPLGLGIIAPLNSGDPGMAVATMSVDSSQFADAMKWMGQTTLKCDGCGLPESDASHKLSLCSRCRMVSYCSAECQRAHWKQSHKAVCAQLTDETEEKGKRIVQEMKSGNVTSLIVFQRDNDAVYAMAVRHGLFDAMEMLFRHEAAGGEVKRVGYCYSYIQEIIVNIFKGDREVIGRFTSACPTRSKEYITSSPTAWDTLMDGMLYLANVLNKTEFQSTRTRNEQELGLAHRAAKDAFATINLALIHKKVAKALFYGSSNGLSGGKRTQSEANDYALQVLVPKIKAFFRNGGEGFAPVHIDHNRTVQAHIYQFTCMLAYWYRTLDINPEHLSAFVDALQLNEKQDQMYETVSRPFGEGAIELGRILTTEETRERTLKAKREYQAKKKSEKRGGKKKGGKKKNRQ